MLTLSQQDQIQSLDNCYYLLKNSEFTVSLNSSQLIFIYILYYSLQF